MQRLWLKLLGIALLCSTIGCSGPSNQALVSGATPTTTDDAGPKTTATSPETIGRVYLANRKLSFMPPNGFIAMPESEIKQTYPIDNPPDYVFTNQERQASIAITLTKQPLTLTQLPELPDLISKHMEKSIPGIKWVERDFLAINGVSWVKLEATSQKQQENLHSDMYFTAFDDHMLGVNFSATSDQYKTIKSAFETSRNSLQIAPEAL